MASSSPIHSSTMSFPLCPITISTTTASHLHHHSKIQSAAIKHITKQRHSQSTRVLSASPSLPNINTFHHHDKPIPTVKNHQPVHCNSNSSTCKNQSQNQPSSQSTPPAHIMTTTTTIAAAPAPLHPNHHLSTITITHHRQPTSTASSLCTHHIEPVLNCTIKFITVQSIRPYLQFHINSTAIATKWNHQQPRRLP